MKAILLIEHKVFSVIFTCNQFSLLGKKNAILKVQNLMVWALLLPKQLKMYISASIYFVVMKYPQKLVSHTYINESNRM